MMGKHVTDIQIIRDRTAEIAPDEGFIRLRRLVLRNTYEDGSESRDYNCDMVLRHGLDAVAVIPYSHRNDGGVDVYLIKSLRPVLTLRPTHPETSPYLNEIVAGIIEPEDEDSPKGILQRAAMEVYEEAGFKVSPEDIEFLGPPLYATPGANTEKLFYATVKVDPALQHQPLSDGSVYEEAADVNAFDLHDALAMCERGDIKDAKTEVALYRLLRRLTANAPLSAGN